MAKPFLSDNMALNLSYSLADQDFHHTKSLGVWNVSIQLLEHLASCPEIEQLTVFTNRKHRNIHLPANARLEQHNAAVSGSLGRVMWDQWGVYSAAERSGNSWLFLPKGFAPILRPCPVHLAAYVHDAMHDHYRHTYNPNPLGRESGYFVRGLEATLRAAKIIFTNTDFTRKEVERLARRWNLPLPKVVHAGVGFDIAKYNHVGQRSRIVVLIGPWPHKCSELAIEQVCRWVNERGFVAGVDWVGAKPPNARIAMRAGWRHYVRLPQHDYEKVLGEAAVVVYFSAYEGYGMPPVEGVLAGAAPVYSNIPAMAEVMGDCGFRFINESYADFARAMDAALAAPPEQVAAWRTQLIARHNWATVAQRIASELSALDAERLRSITEERKASSSPKKILVFAHTPPPHHGQSYMVQQMLTGFGGDQRKPNATPPSRHGIACYHVNARLSRRFKDIGEAHPGKVFLLLWYCLDAIWCRFRHQPDALYYVPAPGKRAALWRDWMVMALCRPFYRHLVLHWHAAGLGSWLEASTGPLTRSITQFSLGRPSLSIIISDFNRFDAEWLRSRAIARVECGIPDPCSDFTQSLLGKRTDRADRFRQLLTAPAGEHSGPDTIFNVLFLANCLRTKGIFDALEAFLQLRERLREKASALRPRFQIAGSFGDAADQREFENRVATSGAGEAIKYLGFVSGESKDQCLRNADLLCFPTYYPGENQPLVLIESLAYGLPAVTTTWRSIPDIFPANYPGIVPPQNVSALAEAMYQLVTFRHHVQLRDRYCEHFTMEAHLRKLAAAINGLR